MDNYETDISGIWEKDSLEAETTVPSPVFMRLIRLSGVASTDDL